jgi:hypothetical protein
VISASGVRIGWADLPARVREAVQTTLGSRIVRADTQAGGFSPGTADREVTEAGGRAFVKAVGRTLNTRSVEIARAELHVTAALPANAPTPRLLGSYDDGDWVALVLEDIDGRHPRTPWVSSEIDATVTALTHCDIRADNLLVRPDGRIVIIDWPWGSTGPAWLDTVLLAVNVIVHGGDADRVLSGVQPRPANAVIAGLTGYFLHQGRLPDPPGLPTVRAFQRAQGDALLPWLRARRPN